MKLHSILLSFVVFLFACLPSALAWEGTVTHVIDGDSIQVTRGNQLLTIRLYGIDTPEHGQDFAQEAKEASRSLVLGEKVEIKQMDIDHYDRAVALVIVRGGLLNGELLRRGLAWFYPRYCTAQPLCRKLQDLEQTARAERRGLWQARNPVPPWVWRHGR